MVGMRWEIVATRQHADGYITLLITAHKQELHQSVVWPRAPHVRACC